MSIPYNINKCLYKRGKTYWVKWYQDSRPRYKSTKLSNKELADEEADKIIIESLKEKGIVVQDILLSELIDKVEQNLKDKVANNELSHNTFDYYRKFHEQIRAEMGHFLLKQITIEDIESYLKNSKKVRKRSLSTSRSEHLTWSKLFKFAVERGYAKENLMAKIAKPKRNTKAVLQQRPIILSEKQVNTLINEATPYLSEIIKFLYNTGLRKGELEYLRFEDINLSAKEISIQIHYDGWQPKGGTERIVPLNEAAYEILSKKIANRKKNQQYVFVSTTGKKVYHYHSSFVKLLKRTGIAEIIPKNKVKGVHMLRHSFCSYLVNEAKVPLPIVKEIMGHQDIKTTMMYVHTDEQQKQLAIRKFDYIRIFKRLREEGKSIDETMGIIVENFDVPIQEVEDILIGYK